MTDSIRSTPLSVKELRQWIHEDRSFYLVDTLPGDHYRKIRLPRALNACVYQVDFLAQFKTITTDIHATIVLYGSGSRSLDSVRAAEKLIRDGFLHVHVLEGGIDAWRSAGLTLTGDAVDAPDDPGTLLSLGDRSCQVDTEQSIIGWTGRNPCTSHFGNIFLSGGEINIRDRILTGVLTVDMHSMVNLDLEGDPLQPVLLAHLKSDDFFLVDRFPTAVLTIVEGRPAREPHTSSPNYAMRSLLTMRGVESELLWTATVARADDNGLAVEAHFDIDRTLWNVMYGSSRYFEHLGMHLVFDPVSMQMRIVAR